MLRWLPEEASDLFQNAVSSLNRQAQAVYGCDLVLADYRGKAGTLSTLDQLWDAFTGVEKAVEALEGYQREYLRAMVAGCKMIVRVMQGDAVPYPQQVRDMQQLELSPIGQDQIESLGANLDKLLYGVGYHQPTVAAKVTAFLADSTLPGEEVASYARDFIKKGRAACIQKVFSLPEGDGIDDIKGVRNVIYNGNSAYLGNYKGRLSFNIDRPWSVPTFANVLCHEGYPGHHAFYCHWDVMFQQGELPLEGAFYIKNTPTNALFEGTPENALHFLGWDDFEEDTPEITPEQKKSFLCGRKILDLQRMYQMNGCYYTNVEGMGQRDATAYMMGSGLFQQSEAEAAYRFFTDATRRTYYPSYYYGRWLVGNAYERFPKERRGEFFHLLYDYPHTNSTFIAAVKQASGEDFEPFSTERRSV